MAWIFALVAVLIGSLADASFTRAVLSGVAAWLFVKYFESKRRANAIVDDLRRLEKDNNVLRARLHALESGAPVEPPRPKTTPTAPPVAAEPPVPPVTREPEDVPQAKRPAPAPDFQIAFESKTPEKPPASEPYRAPEPLRPNPIVTAITHFLTTGNVFAKVGAILLFFGVAFLIKFVSDMGLFPIEGRLIGTALAANGLIAFGWKLRTKRPAYALILQGIGFGILYLTVFGAYGQWHLIPAPLAFGILVAATVLFSLLAVLQNSMALAALAVSGGFLAPLLISTGSNNFVGLFTYYALLNVGVLLVTWFKPWRELHLLGFAFTYGVGFLWGAKYFVPENFVSVEPFLLFHFLLYVVVALRFARLQRGIARALTVDGLLVFGVPMATFALHAAMLKDTRYGIALTAAGLGLFYLSLATVLFRRKNPEARALVESFLTSGLLFNTLAVPFALSHTWTSAVWALEGAFMVWYGARQQRKTIRAFGFLLQALGYIAYLGKSSDLTAILPFVNPAFLGALTLFLAALATSYQLFKKPETFSKEESALLKPFLFFASAWILYGLYNEAFVSARYWVGDEAVGFNAMVASLRVGFFGGIVLLLHWAARRLAWAALAGIRFALFIVVFFAWPMIDSGRAENVLPYLNPAFLSAMIFMAAALISSSSFLTAGVEARTKLVARFFLVFGYSFWTIAHWTELSFAFQRWAPSTSDSFRVNTFVMVLAASALFFSGLARGFRKPMLGEYRHALTAFGTVFLFAQYFEGKSPFVDGGILAWASLFGAHYFLLWRSERNGSAFHYYAHFTGLWLLTAVLGWAGFNLAESHVSATSVWKEVFLLAVAMSVVAIVLQWRGPRFPVGRNRDAYVAWGLLPHILALTVFAQYWNLVNPGDPTPLPYLPALNPLGIAIGASLLLLVYWFRAANGLPWRQYSKRFSGLVGCFAFLWLTMGVVRAVHHSTGVHWDPDELWSSGQLQAALSIFWSFLGLVTMIVGHRRGVRALWIFGCCLLVLVVVKLFAVDLAERGTLERIISFIGTGVVLLLTGYFAPIPPSTKKASHEAH